MLKFDQSEVWHTAYGQASQVTGIAYVIRFGEELTDLALPEIDQPVIPITIDETRRDESYFRPLTPASVALLSAVPGFVTLGRSEKGEGTHIATVLRGLDSRSDFLGIACSLHSYRYTLQEVDDMKNVIRGWDGQPIQIVRSGLELVIDRVD